MYRAQMKTAITLKLAPTGARLVQTRQQYFIDLAAQLPVGEQVLTREQGITQARSALSKKFSVQDTVATSSLGGGGSCPTVARWWSSFAAKSAPCLSLTGFSKCIAEDLKHVIKFTLFYFGGVNSPFWNNVSLKTAKMLSPETAADAILHALDRSSVPVELTFSQKVTYFLAWDSCLVVTCKSSQIGKNSISCYAGFSDVIQVITFTSM